MEDKNQPDPDIPESPKRHGAMPLRSTGSPHTEEIPLPKAPFPLDAVPGPIRSIALNLSRYSRLDLSFHAMVATAIVSAAIGRCFKIRSTYFTKPTHGNLLVVLCADTARGKGILDTYMGPIFKYEERLVESFAEEQSGHVVELKILETKLRKQIRQAVKAPDVLLELHKDGLLQLQSEVDALKAKIDFSPQLYLNHSTGAYLRKTLSRNGGDCFLYSPEGSGNLLNAFNGGDPLLAELLLSGFSNERVKKDTLACRYGGSPCLSGLFALQSWRLREIMFSKTASPLGFLNRLVIVDSGRLPQRELDPYPRPDPEAEAAWQRLVSRVLDARLSGNADLTLPLSREAEKVFLGYRQEVNALVESMPGEIHEHLGRFPEIAMRLCAVFLALEHLGQGYPIPELSEHGELAENAVAITRWLLDHRLSIHREHLEGHYHDCCLKLDKMLKQNGGFTEERIITANHKDLADAMDYLLTQHPDRFVRKEIKTGKRGPKTTYITSTADTGNIRTNESTT